MGTAQESPEFGPKSMFHQHEYENHELLMCIIVTGCPDDAVLFRVRYFVVVIMTFCHFLITITSVLTSTLSVFGIPLLKMFEA